jgi:hypothetical protein
LFFNSFISAWQGSSARATSSCFNLSAFAGRDINVIVSHLTSPDFLAATDSIEVEFTTNGTSYTRIGSLQRVDPNAATDGEWAIDTLTFSATANLTELRFGFTGFGENGNNMAIDYFRVEEGLPTGVKNRATTTLAVYPNPTTGTFILTGIPAKALGTSINVVDVQGKVLTTRTLAREMDLTGLANGLYYLVGSGIKTKVFVTR